MTYRSEEFETTPKSRNTRTVQLVFLLAIVATAAAALAYREPLWGRVTRVLATANDEPIPTQNLERVSFRLETPAVGEIIGLETLPVPTPSTRGGGLKIAWLIPEGSFVKPGDTVVRFDSTDAQLNLEQQQNTLEANQERTKITTGKQTTDEKVLGIDRTDAEKEYQHAMTVMPQDETIFSKWDIIEAKINAGFAKERINFLSNKGRVQKRIARADQQILAIEKNKARAEISVAQQTLDSLELRAPKGGLVLYRRDRMREPQVGDESWPGQVLVEVVDLHALQARIYVLERDAAGLAQDKAVDYSTRLNSGEDLPRNHKLGGFAGTNPRAQLAAEIFRLPGYRPGRLRRHAAHQAWNVAEGGRDSREIRLMLRSPGQCHHPQGRGGSGSCERGRPFRAQARHNRHRYSRAVRRIERRQG